MSRPLLVFAAFSKLLRVIQARASSARIARPLAFYSTIHSSLDNFAPTRQTSYQLATAPYIKLSPGSSPLSLPGVHLVSLASTPLAAP